MTIHMLRDINQIKKNVILLSSEVQKRLDEAIRAAIEMDKKLAKKVKKADIEIDEREVKLEEDILKTLALHQPVAVDLRFLIAVLKMNNDLERIGDEAVNICSRVIKLANFPLKDKGTKLKNLTQKVKNMVNLSIESLIEKNSELAIQVCQADDEIDKIVHKQFNFLKDKIKEDPDNIEFYFGKARIYRHLERIADHATNIAEDVIYMVEGEIVRHQEGDIS